MMCNEKEIDESVTYRVVPGVPGRLVGDDGSYWRLKPIKPSSRGYSYIKVCDRKVRIYSTLQEMILTAFVGPRPEGKECCHNDGNPRNNRLSNLRWDTHQANIADKKIHGTELVGSKSNPAKLTESQIPEIRRLLKLGLSCGEIGKMFGVCKGTISVIGLGYTWIHVPDVVEPQDETGADSYDAGATDELPPDRGS
jgi:hypothetical protein